MKLEYLSRNVTDVMSSLARNEALVQLLVNNDDTPYHAIPADYKMGDIAKPKKAGCKIFPFPFDPNAQTKDGSFIRVYYNIGFLNSNETIADLKMHIDIIVAKNLWLISNGDKALIRPYEIMSRVIDMVGKNNAGSLITLKFDDFRHFPVNNKFESIRLYASYMSVQTSTSL